MNCPFKKNPSRILSLILALTLLTGMLSGCMGGGEPTEPELDPPLALVDSKPTEEPTETSTEPSEDATEPTYDENTAFAIGQVNILSQPSTKGTVIGYLNDGDQVEILQVEELHGVEWALIRDGWVAMEGLQLGAPPDGGSDAEDPQGGTDATEPKDDDKTSSVTYKATITATDLNIRKEPSTNAAKVGSYPKGTTVTILETKGDWGRTDKGWISLDYVQKATGTTNTDNKDDETGTEANIKAVVTANELNIRSEASTTADRKGAYVYGDRITILETKGDWGRTDKGWISLAYVYQDGAKGTNGCKGIVTGDQLNVRSGPGTGYDKVDTLVSGDRVNVLQRITYGDTTWGCTKDGWIAMNYIYVDGTTGEGSGNGTVTGNGVNVRTGPGTGYDVVGSLNEGDDVKIYAQFKIGNMTWGCTDNGWISMDYVEIDD